MEHLTLRNFGPIKAIDIDLKKVNVFIGEQGVGKSTIAKLLSCLRDVSLYDIILNKRGDGFITQIFAVFGIQDYFHTDTYIKYYDGNEISIIYSDGKFRIKSRERNFEDLKEFIGSIINRCLNETLEGLGVKANTLSKDELQQLMDKHRRILASNLRMSFYCPAERGIAGVLSNSIASLMLSEVPLPDTLLEYMSFFEKAKNHFKTYELPFLHSKYMLKAGVDTVECDGATVPLSYCSSGMQSILPLLMVIDYCVSENYFQSFTIEEPELNLFPSNQLELLRQIIAKTNTEKCEVGTWSLTTHSPYILSILNLSLMGGVILDKFPDSAKAISDLIPIEYLIKPDEIAVYALSHSGDGKQNCTDIIDHSTGLIKANYLDSVSDVLAGEFRSLNKLYLNFLKNAK